MYTIKSANIEILVFFSRIHRLHASVVRHSAQKWALKMENGRFSNQKFKMNMVKTLLISIHWYHRADLVYASYTIQMLTF